MTEKELTALFEGNESERFERTESGRDRDKIGRAICAFANDVHNRRLPGVIFIGQRDKGECANLSIDDDLLKNMGGFASDENFTPEYPIISVDDPVLHGCKVCAIVVQPSATTPVRYKGTCWVRVGPRQQRATPVHEVALTEKRQSGDAPFISQAPRPPVPLEELNLPFFQQSYLPQAVSAETLAENQRDVSHHLASLGFLTRDGHPNHAALLCFHDTPQQYLPGAYIQFARWSGTDIAERENLIAEREIGGNVFDMMQEIDVLISGHLNKTLVFSDTRHTARWDYPLVALQEIIRNAIVHRQYQGTAAPVHVYWFADRIEIRSPGGLYGECAEDTFGTDAGHADYRNKALAHAFKNMGYIERFGSGIPRANRAMQHNGNPAIEFNAKHGVTVILKPATHSS